MGKGPWKSSVFSSLSCLLERYGNDDTIHIAAEKRAIVIGADFIVNNHVSASDGLSQ